MGKECKCENCGCKNNPNYTGTEGTINADAIGGGSGNKDASPGADDQIGAGSAGVSA